MFPHPPSNVLHSAWATLALATVLLGSGRFCQAGEPVPEDPCLEVVAQYFNESDATARSKLLAPLESCSQGSWSLVAQTLERVNVWERLDIDAERLSTARDSLRVFLPRSYDPARRAPLILIISAELADQPTDQQRRWLDSGFVIAKVDPGNTLDFAADPADADRPLEWLSALRRRYRLDTQRTYLYAEGPDADRAFSLAIFHADLFAEGVLREGTLNLPYRRVLQRLLLSNLAHTPMQLFWHEPHVQPGDDLTDRLVSMALGNRSIAAFAREAGLPLQTFVSDGTPSLTFPTSMFTRPAPDDVRAVSHWFRHPGQGHAWFLKQADPTASAWTGDQIHLQVADGGDWEAYARGVFESKLGYLRGTIDGQTVRIDTQHCEAVQILLQPGSVDFDQPIRVIYNDKVRFEDRVRPSISTLLSSAFERWEFQRHVVARLRLSDKGRVLPY